MRKYRLQPPSTEIAASYFRLFVNRRAYTLQSDRADTETGRHYYFRPKDKATGEGLSLSLETLRHHIGGEITIALYAIHPSTQRCRWVAIDADYENALTDLIKLAYFLKQDGVESALEKSNRGGHLWVFMAEPLPARDCRIYVYDLAQRLGVPVKGFGLREGIEVFPKHDELKPGEYGNAIRGPLGIHRGAAKRFWFYGADYDIAKQMRYLVSLPKVTAEKLAKLIEGKTLPPQFAPAKPSAEPHGNGYSSGCGFRILDHIKTRLRQVGRNHVTQCPSCASDGHDRDGDNLAVSIEDPRKYLCWAGCTSNMIRAAVGCPKREPSPVR